MVRWNFVALLVFVSACATPDEKARWNREAAARQQAEQQAYFATLQERCAAYGFLRGTNGFADCVRQEDLCEQQRKSAALDYNIALVQEGSKRGATLGTASAKAARRAQLSSRLCR